MLVALAPIAAAQDRGVEITPTVGYRFGGRVSTFDNTIIDSIEVPETVSYGIAAEWPVRPNLNLEVLWSHQDISLEAQLEGTPPAGVDPAFSHFNIDTVQVGGLWQSGRRGDEVRGYFDFLVGRSVLTPAPEYESLTRFSMTLGGGAKFRISDKIGFRIGLRWMPVYLSSEGTGYGWCDPCRGCTEYYESNYLYQTDAHVGLILKFRPGPRPENQGPFRPPRGAGSRPPLARHLRC
ncbi:MAG: hypothetical protein IPP07_13260 [Holophagales bacterium]|nr:hypothetical protein [Holophagales bacterium]MBK9965807.1 hypothetical protein [Holophagales bacterium]